MDDDRIEEREGEMVFHGASPLLIEEDRGWMV